MNEFFFFIRHILNYWRLNIVFGEWSTGSVATCLPGISCQTSFHQVHLPECRQCVSQATYSTLLKTSVTMRAGFINACDHVWVCSNLLHHYLYYVNMLTLTGCQLRTIGANIMKTNLAVPLKTLLTLRSLNICATSRMHRGITAGKN